MKKCISMLAALAILACALVPCASVAEGGQVQIVTTIFPIYDWVREITRGDDSLNIKMLLDSGVDLHSYQPTAADIMSVATCDLFIYVGGESDEWVEDALAEAVNPDMVVINLLEALGDDVKAEELVEGMEPEEEDEEDEDEDEVELDEHVWLSLRNAVKLSPAIADDLATINPEKAGLYEANLADYVARLTALDDEYAAMVAGSAYHTVLFGDRFPFRYLVDDYGIDYYAAFVGCSAETEASFATIAFLAGKVDELNLPAVMTIEGANHKIAETIIRETATRDQRLLVMNSMQGITALDVDTGATYIDIMQGNLEMLTLALN